MTRLQGKTALVTGAGSGIGRAIALAFATAGADIVISDVRRDDGPEQVADAVRSFGRRALVVRADVMDRGAVDAMVRDAVASMGRIDILATCAGVNIYQPFLEIEQRVWDLTIGVDQTGVFNCCQEVARYMVARGGGGKLVVIASVSAEQAYRNQAHYCAAKAAVVKLVEGMAYELGVFGITANAISPGWVETPFTTDYLADPGLRKQVEATIPLGRVAAPADIASVAVFLASSDGDYVSGAHIRVDGALIAGRDKM